LANDVAADERFLELLTLSSGAERDGGVDCVQRGDCEILIAEAIDARSGARQRRKARRGRTCARHRLGQAIAAQQPFQHDERRLGR